MRGGKRWAVVAGLLACLLAGGCQLSYQGLFCSGCWSLGRRSCCHRARCRHCAPMNVIDEGGASCPPSQGPPAGGAANCPPPVDPYATQLFHPVPVRPAFGPRMDGRKAGQLISLPAPDDPGPELPAPEMVPSPPPSPAVNNEAGGATPRGNLSLRTTVNVLR